MPSFGRLPRLLGICLQMKGVPFAFSRWRPMDTCLPILRHKARGLCLRRKQRKTECSYCPVLLDLFTGNGSLPLVVGTYILNSFV